MRQLCPEVAVPEIPVDPAHYDRELERYRYFMNSFPKSLGLVAPIEPISATISERSTQLINRSNQFNLTTQHRSNADLLGRLAESRWITATVSSQGRLGDNGLVRVVPAKVEADALTIDTWVMSCRVLKRGVEQFLLKHLAGLALERGLVRLLGEFTAGITNKLAADCRWIDANRPRDVSLRVAALQERINLAALFAGQMEIAFGHFPSVRFAVPRNPPENRHTRHGKVW